MRCCLILILAMVVANTMACSTAKASSDSVVQLHLTVAAESTYPVTKVNLVAGNFVDDSVGVRMAMSMVGLLDGVLVSDQLTAPHLMTISPDSTGRMQRFGPHATRSGGVIQARLLDPVTDDDSGLLGVDLTRERIVLASLFTDTPQVRDVGAVPMITERGPSFIARWPGGYVLGGDFADDLVVKVDTSSGNVTRFRVPMLFDSTTMQNGVFRAKGNEHELAIAPGSRRIAVAYKHANRIDFLDLASESGLQFHGPSAPLVKWRLDSITRRLTWEHENQLGYVAVSVTDRRVYGLYCGCRTFERFAREVHVWDYSGRLVSVLTLDRTAYSFAVDREDRHLYAATWTPSEGIVWYKLPASSKAEGK